MLRGEEGYPVMPPQPCPHTGTPGVPGSRASFPGHSVLRDLRSVSFYTEKPSLRLLRPRFPRGRAAWRFLGVPVALSCGRPSASCLAPDGRWGCPQPLQSHTSQGVSLTPCPFPPVNITQGQVPRSGTAESEGTWV